MIKKIIPPKVRLQIRIWQKHLKDQQNGYSKHLIKQDARMIELPSQIQISQPIKSNAYSDNKIHNLNLAIKAIEKREIKPGEIFSFWQMIPRPIKANGFKKGRNLIGEDLATDYGGGLCQMSGILYHLALIGGLEIIERFPHSKDIYTEKTRYTPLGSDATVVYGHKDLRIRNNLTQAISFQFQLLQDKITAFICAATMMNPQILAFESDDHGHYRMARVHYVNDGIKKMITEDRYDCLYS